MSSSYTPPNRPDATSTTGRMPAYGSTTSGTDTDVRPVRPRGHVRDDLGLLILRLGLAVVLLAHGYQKFFGQSSLSFVPTQNAFAAAGIPVPQVTAILAVVVELVGGVLLVFGFLTVIISLLVAVGMAAAIWYVHLPNGFFEANGGYEFTALLGVVAVVLVITGAGKISLDRAFFGGKRRQRAREARDAGVS